MIKFLAIFISTFIKIWDRKHRTEEKMNDHIEEIKKKMKIVKIKPLSDKDNLIKNRLSELEDTINKISDTSIIGRKNEAKILTYERANELYDQIGRESDKYFPTVLLNKMTELFIQHEDFEKCAFIKKTFKKIS